MRSVNIYRRYLTIEDIDIVNFTEVFFSKSDYSMDWFSLIAKTSNPDILLCFEIHNESGLVESFECFDLKHSTVRTVTTTSKYLIDKDYLEVCGHNSVFRVTEGEEIDYDTRFQQPENQHLKKILPNLKRYYKDNGIKIKRIVSKEGQLIIDTLNSFEEL